MGFPGGSKVKASACNVGDLGLIPGSGRSPGEGNSNPLQYSCLENPMDGGDWWATVHRVAESDMTERLRFHFIDLHILWWVYYRIKDFYKSTDSLLISLLVMRKFKSRSLSKKFFLTFALCSVFFNGRSKHNIRKLIPTLRACF